MELDSKQIEEIVRRVLSNVESNNKSTLTGADIPVGISARHIHLTREDCDTLFGAGYELTHFKDLSQPGQFACKEQLTIIGPSLKAIEGLRVLGPLRKRSQVEISKTDAYVLKAKPPVRESGDLDGSSPITIIGPKGVVELKEGLIIANRHIHMSPSDALRYSVKDGDYVSVETVGVGKRTKLYDCQIRVNDNFILEMHLDTDDANACGLINGDKVKLVKEN